MRILKVLNMSDLKSLLPLSACVGTSMSLFKKLETVSGLSTENIFSSVQLKKKKDIYCLYSLMPFCERYRYLIGSCLRSGGQNLLIL